MRRRAQNGFLLLAVLVIVMLASMVAISLIFRLRADQASFAAISGSEQAWSAAMSGVQQAINVVQTSGDNAANWQNNAAAFHHQLVVDDVSDRWYFTVYSRGTANEPELRHGLTDEAGKINIKKADAATLRQLLNPTAEAEPTAAPGAFSLDGSAAQKTNGNAFSFGAEVKGFSTLDDLLTLPGFSDQLLYGEDANRNFWLDAGEDDGDASYPPDNHDGILDSGWSEFLTVYSYDLNVSTNGEPRFQLNSAETNWPPNLLPEKTASYLLAAKANKRRFASPADLLGAKEPSKNEKGEPVELEPGVGAPELAVLMTQFTASPDRRITGLINVNTAPARVLKTLPGIDEAKAEAIVSSRDALSLAARESPAWLFQEGIVDGETFKKIAPLATTRAYQFQFHVIGYALPSGRFRNFEAVIDTALPEPQLVYLRELTRLGLPFPLPTDKEQTDGAHDKK